MPRCVTTRKVAALISVMYYRINKTPMLLAARAATYKYVELMSLPCRLLTYGVVQSRLAPAVVLAKLMTPKLTVLSSNYLRLRPLGRTAVMDRS